MSAVAMAELVIQRRATASRSALETAERSAELGQSAPRAEPASTSAQQGTAITDALKLVTSYIPTEVLTLYVAATALFLSADGTVNLTAAWPTFFAFAAMTPVVNWMVFAAKMRGAGQPLPVSPSTWPKFEMFAATLAFVTWAAALPQSPFATMVRPEVAGFLVLVITTLLGLVSPLVHR